MQIKITLVLTRFIVVIVAATILVSPFVILSGITSHQKASGQPEPNPPPGGKAIVKPCNVGTTTRHEGSTTITIETTRGPNGGCSVSTSYFTPPPGGHTIVTSPCGSELRPCK